MTMNAAATASGAMSSESLMAEQRALALETQKNTLETAKLAQKQKSAEAIGDLITSTASQVAKRTAEFKQ